MTDRSVKWACSPQRTREELADAWAEHVHWTHRLHSGAEFAVPVAIARLNAEQKAANCVAHATATERRVTEYKALILDVLDAVDEADSIEGLREALAGFDVEDKAGAPAEPLAVWREFALRRENAKVAS